MQLNLSEQRVAVFGAARGMFRIICFLLALAASSRAADWSAFRGSAGDGISPEDKAPLHWAPDRNILEEPVARPGK